MTYPQIRTLGIALFFIAVAIAMSSCAAVQAIAPALQSVTRTTDMYAAGYKKDDSVCAEFLIREKTTGITLRAAQCWYLWDIWKPGNVAIAHIDSSAVVIDSTGSR